MSTAQAGLIIRELASVAELKQAESFQRTVWGADDPADNADIMLAIQHEGGLVAGAFRDERMLGFLFGFPSSTPAVQHSHRLAVHPDSRGMGLGASMKWYQRDWCLARGITLVRWTYDPLLSINATLNIDRLGATAGIYLENYYGDMFGINAGVPSDRLMAEWQLDSERVELRAANQRLVSVDAGSGLTVTIASDFGRLLREDLTTAQSERLRVRGELQSAFEQGYRITGFDRQDLAYRLTRT